MGDRVKMRLKKGDQVLVLSGKDVGKQGAITRVLPDRNMVIIDGINVAKKHQRSTKATMQGGIIDKDMPVPASNVAIVCATCGPTRIGYRFDDEGQKFRVCKKCGKDL